jgi:glucuronoarabinoxylan endo-1,4-beta-xylanase
MRYLCILVFFMGSALAQTITITPSTTYQTIDGFGVAVANNRATLNATQADILYGQGARQVGLTILRTWLQSDSNANVACDPGQVAGIPLNNENLNAVQLAYARGAKITASSWTVPSSMKTGSSTSYCLGGSFVGGTANYTALATDFANGLAYLNTHYAIPIYAFSPQNEPSIDTTSGNYAGTVWTAQQMHDFLPYLHTALNNAGLSNIKVMISEDNGWSFGTAATAMADATVAPDVAILAAHNYDMQSPSSPPSVTGRTTQPFWQTEISTFDGFDPSMANGMIWAQQIHYFLSGAQVSAWLYWQAYASIYWTDNEVLIGNDGTVAKRAYVMGQWSRFVRPGWQEIGVTNSTSLLVTAFRDPVSGNTSIVVVNPSASAVGQAFSISGTAISSLTPYLTDGGTNNIAQLAPIALTSNAFSYTIPASSVITFSNYVSGAAPPTITTSCPLSPGRTGIAYAAQMAATGTAPITWDLSTGSLPNGLGMSAAGLVSGTPTTAGTSNFTLRATNTYGNNTESCSLVIAVATPTITITGPLRGPL